MAMMTYHNYFRTISSTIHRYCVSTTDCFSRTAQAITSRSVLAGLENRRFCSTFHQRKPHHILAGCSLFTHHHSLESRALHTGLVLRKKLPPKSDQESDAKFESPPSHSNFADSMDTPLTDEEQIMLVKTEYELMKEDGDFNVPSKLSESQMKQLVETRGVFARRNILRHFFLIEVKRINENEKRVKKRVLAEERYAQVQVELKEENHLYYGLWKNCYFIRYSKQYMDNIHLHKLASAAMFGQPLVFDNSFDSHMNYREKSSLLIQLRFCVNKNREHVNPFSFHMCNFDHKHNTASKFSEGMPKVLMDVHKESYLDLFPKERLVYLTPDCKSELVEYDHDAIYIVGNIVDRGDNVPYCLAKAKAEGIKMRKFPIERFVDWGTGGKSLTLNAVIEILLEVKESGSWGNAFKKIPNRKFKKQIGHGKLEQFANKIKDNKRTRHIIKSLVDE